MCVYICIKFKKLHKCLYIIKAHMYMKIFNRGWFNIIFWHVLEINCRYKQILRIHVIFSFVAVVARENVQRIPLNLHYRAHETATKRRPWMSSVFMTYRKMKDTSCNYCSVFDSCCVYLEWEILHFFLLIIYNNITQPFYLLIELTRTMHMSSLLLILFEQVSNVHDTHT